MAIAELFGVLAQSTYAEWVPPSTSQVLYLPRGSDVDVDLRLFDELQQPVDLAPTNGEVLTLYWKRTFEDEPIVARVATKLPERGMYRFSIARTDTEDLSGKFSFDVWATIASGGCGGSVFRRQVVQPGYLTIGQGIGP